jgi:hypothetical protein
MKLKAFIPACYIAGILIAQAQLSGEVSLGGASSDQPQEEKRGNPQTKEITVTGLGENPRAAVKQAITDAVRQAVGAYIDANTLVENEEVVRDRILSVSDGFVKEYKVTSPARQRDDSLYEITIIAIVETKQVVQALKEMNLITGEVTGQNLWAEASTKVMNVQDAVKMLEEKLPEFIKNSMTIMPLGKNGKPQAVTDSPGKTISKMDPAILTQDPVTGKANLIWILEVDLDKKYYKEQVIPVLLHCFNAISGEKPIEREARCYPEKVQITDDNKSHIEKLNLYKTEVSEGYEKALHGPNMKIIVSVSRAKDSFRYLAYSSDAIDGIECLNNEGYFEHLNNSGVTGAYLVTELMDENDEIISSFKQVCWQPFQWSYFHSENLTGSISLPSTIFSEIEIPIDLLREIKRVKFRFEVPELRVKLKSTSE